MDLVRALRRRALGQEINFLEKPTQEVCDLSAFSDLLCVLLRIIHGGLVIFVSRYAVRPLQWGRRERLAVSRCKIWKKRERSHESHMSL